MKRDTLDALVKRLLRENSVSLTESITQTQYTYEHMKHLFETTDSWAGIPRKAEGVKFCELEWIDGNHIKGKVQTITGRDIGTFTVELFAGPEVPKESIKGIRKEHTMRNLYSVFVVDPNEDAIETALVISKSSDGAKFKALTDLQESLKKDIDEYDILVVPQGHVRDKREVQEVKLVTD